jgi:hypothetical protein
MTVDRWLAVIGILLTWLVTRYYYRRSEKRRAPTFIVESVKVLVDSGLRKIGGFSVLWERLAQGRDIEVGDDGISEAIIVFWNSGTLPILAGQILEPYTITTRGVPLLNYSVLKSSREVIGMQLSRVGEDGDSLELGFSVLEPGDGVTIRLIFDGPPKTKIVFSGTCLECRKPTVLDPDPIYSLPRFKRLRDTYGVLITSIVGPPAVVVGGLWALGWVVRKLFGQHALDVAQAAVGIIVALLVLWVVGFVLWYQFRRLTAPYLPPDIKE